MYIRYKIYAEGFAWSVSLKYILACGSETLIIDPQYEDFFSRGLIPKENFWPIRSTDLCQSIKEAVEWGNGNSRGVKPSIEMLVYIIMKPICTDAEGYHFKFQCLSILTRSNFVATISDFTCFPETSGLMNLEFRTISLSAMSGMGMNMCLHFIMVLVAF
jgi:Glycosyl transferase family 90